MEKIHKLIIYFIFLINMTGCMITPYGNYASAQPNFNRAMAEDTTNQLVSLYPPAHTRFNIKQSITDGFGTALIQSLRLKGYAIHEENQTQTQCSQAIGIDLGYLIDVPSGTNLYRVTVTIGQQSLSQVYRPAQDGKVYAAGSWVRKE
jgi:hypothetical protein